MNFNGTDKRYNQFSAHLKNKFGAKVYKITIDAGFSCPNRDGTISSGGCIFCDGSGSFSRAHSNTLTIEEQVETGIKNLSERFGAEKFMSYFQAYTNTYKPVNELEKIQEITGKISNIMNPATFIVINVATAFVIYVGAIRVDVGDLTQGQVVALVNYMSQILVELVKLANLIITITKAIASGRATIPTITPAIKSDKKVFAL